MESVLDALRAGRRNADEALLDLLFRSADLLESTIEAAVAGRDGEIPTTAVVQRLRHVGVIRANAVKRVAAPNAPGTLVRVVVETDAPLRGVRAFMAVNHVRSLGEVTAIEPSLDELQFEAFDHDFAFRVVTSATADEIERAVRRAGDIERVAVGEDAPDRVDHPAEDEPPVPANGAGATLPPSSGSSRPGSGQTTRRMVRVDLRRLDTLMNVVGELVVTRGRLQQLVGEDTDSELGDTVMEASRLIGELRDEITASRLVPTWQVFDRFPRLVRDTARALGKEVDFVVQGRDIELDRSMLDEIADSLVHLLRNSIDHGIELPEARVAAGKPRAGRLTLIAARERSAAVIRVSDDGRGIDRARVLARAKRDGLVDPSVTEFSDEELLRILTRPGFSTADRITDVSGRGVGIDAVHTRVRALGGAIDVKSVEGEGTSISLRLPPTLAIVRAVLARIGEETYAIPAAHVAETIEITPDLVATVQDREMLRLRGDVLPLVRLRSLFQLPETDPAFARGSSDLEQGVILDLGDRLAALVVDDLVGQEEIVVKPFDPVRGALPYFGGATLLADGAPALIVDVSTLV
jgi:two-component system chemotaxis sensor kinase CheA